MPRNAAAGTAFGPIVLSAVEQCEPPERRLVDDDLAALFLPLPLRAVVAATRVAPIRRAVVRASERVGPGLWANIACRKRYIDDTLAAAMSGVDAVVVLGAGLDTRAYRLARRNDVPVFEADLPINVARKRNIVARVLGAPPPSVHLVPLDFERDDLLSVLESHGYRRDARTFFVWEGVTQYLTEAAVHSTFGQLSGAAAGSRIDFTYVRSDFVDGTEMYGAPALYRKFRERSDVWKFGLPPDGIAEFLAGYGWRLIEQAGPDEFMSRYVAPTGRGLRTSQIEWSVYAEKV
ncbi:SAM-dependent methyltransferase [Mycolicibacterium arenosum]|uniref:S-adenosyl-L-methionine-dependent methyltransferase n=1 Tax=Mycolicibacterium arenosum TaxID=2952157 RepID=A0ABT1M1W5_9MYCO|nr:SAM-dependent methyltransferase [Mycolicibacterium sp. CAU 1645]MCP9273139.1 SAM-dependent methyltransferase [Mycolicibacterium sp. CAU 1645]